MVHVEPTCCSYMALWGVISSSRTSVWIRPLTRRSSVSQVGVISAYSHGAGVTR